MNIKRARWLIAVGSAVIAVASRGVRAESAAPRDPMQEAAERTREGVRHADRQEFESALANFQRAYELSHNPVLLLNVASMYEALNRPAEATEAFDRALADKSALPPDKLAHLIAERDEQAARTGQLNIVCNVAAEIEIDNLARGNAPLASPIRVSAGTHVVGGIARGYAPFRIEVSVAPKTLSDVNLTLIPMAAVAAHLWVKTHLPEAELTIDGKRVGRTPLPKSLAVVPGDHQVELTRPGYVTGELTLEPKIDRSTFPSEWGSLALTFSEPQATVTIDGSGARGDLSLLELPRGTHHLQLERPGFLAIERDVTIEPHQTTHVRVEFDANSDTRAAYASSVSARRTWGTVLTIAGGAVAGFSGGYLIYNQGQKSDAERAYNALVAQTVPGGTCDFSVVSGNPLQNCKDGLSKGKSRLDDLKTRQTLSYVGIGVGAASLGVGLTLLFTAGDPHRYDHAANPRRRIARARRVSDWALGMTPGGAVLSGRF
jgi:tetratricopeptide (TPR) repeat protein